MEQIKLAELRGFFYADGTVSLHKRILNNKYIRKDGTRSEKPHQLYAIRIHIAQRIDNLPLLEEYKKEYGGQIYIQRPTKKEKYESKPSAYWSIQSIDGCQKILNELLKTQFTYRSRDAVVACKEYCDWKLERGVQKKYTEQDRQKIEEWIARVRAAHKYQVIK